MNSTVYPYSFPAKWLRLLVFLPLLIAFMFAQIANAGLYRPQMVFLNTASQAVDTDGDGRLDTFSTDVMVYEDGTAEGTVELNEGLKVIIDSGTINVATNGDYLIGLDGHDLFGKSYRLSLSFNTSGDDFNGDGHVDITDYVIWRASFPSGHVNSFGATVQISIR